MVRHRPKDCLTTWPKQPQPNEIVHHLTPTRSLGTTGIQPARFLSILLIILFVPMHAWGQKAAKAVQEQVTDTVTIQQKTQAVKDDWAAEKASLEARYRAAKAQLEALAKQKIRLENKTAGVESRIKELQRRLEESTRLEQGLQETMETLLTQLEAWVARDLPFLPEERATRLTSLKETLYDARLSPAEKLRHLLEALQVEGDYGDTVEVYQQRIDVEGQKVFADILRLGRLSIFWQTPDGKRVGEYDRVGKKWVEFPAGFNRSIQIAIEIANKRRPIELIRVPVGRLAP